jgi:protein-export membrane protein SecD
LKDRDNTVTDRYWRTQYLESKIWLTGAQLTRAGATLNEQNQPAVSLTLNSEGAKILADVSERLAPTKDHFAIMLDDEVVSAPFFNEKIPSGRAEISMGSGTRSQAMLEARTLSDILNNGAYQAPVYEVAHNTVGPQLGADQVSAGTIALLLGLALVIAFMILYYRVSGVIAVMVLIFNMLLIIMLLVGFNSALELPGIAGIILTIGMAVDANIIIFERIREELLAGRSPRAAVDTGYAKALSAILDANITTALAGIILLNYTSGTIHNFAVTLLMGIACSVFTAVIVARMIFNYWLNSKKPSTLSI